MKTTQYIYGIDPDELENKYYFEALQYKKEEGIKLYRKLFLKHNKTEDDTTQMFWVAKGLDHTEKLLDEWSV